ncbi:hypothetical protein ARMGADRAFT_428830 [Armillaria gallica]|uniref:Uncharacterized protein n=1 Tax=Armillaria gallica TaxID=47427 RepID=A0A2H3D2I4_ARMGA|nr:hypothetical protein ARMGADRAFT_428830 [Armillaria gallica]
MSVRVSPPDPIAAPLLPSLNADSPDDRPTSANKGDDSVQLEAPILRQDDLSTPTKQGCGRIECSLDGDGGWAKTEKHANHDFFTRRRVEGPNFAQRRRLAIRRTGFLDT